ncbi:large-conductance mechanosensitive channel protein MscL [Furfurilactobacillus siliginis]|uniref:Large-conductance mechanosensitive channel n=1 Tax=Furfurilactobacillus siliginis TaxID=348151 RepID=A0A0R2KVS2_9LACO|nr:large-conductance mechanosensitive channel protein MscL [Furfurilactobacillus siliginis]KRN93679.1 large-conductance mechanosensitive channel [Furfurilactobacillus siliginis]GEK28385.1 large-conductance mechanosensitive channel [Furfurilactobacillus siliginis]
MWKEFKEFISRGNVIDLAVGVIIGSAFTAIVKSLVSTLINPLLGIFTGSIDFSSWVVKIGSANFRFGSFINAVINFLIIAFVVFLLVKAINRIMPAKKEITPAESTTDHLLAEIRDELRQQNGHTDADDVDSSDDNTNQ